jgi:transcription antitermination factor NusG
MPDLMPTQDECSSWVAVQTAPRRENNVATLLTYKGYSCFLPQYTARRRWSDRYKTVELPLFPSYLFCRTTCAAAGLVVTTPAVIRVVGAGGKPLAIPDSEIQALKVIASARNVAPCSYVNVGERVRVARGPLSGIEGILTSIRNHQRIIVSVEGIMRSVAVEVDACDIEPADTAHRP